MPGTVPGARCQVRCKVPSAWCQVPGARCPLPGASAGANYHADGLGCYTARFWNLFHSGKNTCSALIRRRDQEARGMAGFSLIAQEKRYGKSSSRGQSTAFARHAQPAPPAPQLPAGNELSLDRDTGPAPTIPGLESSFVRLVLRHSGHPATRSVVTNASKVRPQSRHSYSKRGMAPILQEGAGCRVEVPGARCQVRCWVPGARGVS